jgi:hypothetical protein
MTMSISRWPMIKKSKNPRKETPKTLKQKKKRKEETATSLVGGLK